MIGLWIVLAVVVGPFAAKLSSVTSDKVVDTLPASAESTRVAAIEDSQPDGDAETFVFLYHRDGALTAADRSAAERHYRDLVKRYPAKNSTPAPDDEEQSPLMLAEDGKAVMFTLEVSASYGGPEDLVGPLREAATDRPAGLKLHVTGPGGVDGDLDAVFEGLDVKVFLTTVLVVAVLLILTYRSPVLWFVPLLAVGVAAFVSMATVYWLVRTFGIVVNDQNSAILTILVFGVGTDYALLLIARYRETLHQYESVWAAMVHAWRRTVPAILASAGTVVAGMMCLLAADLNSTSGLGPVGAVGVICALLAMVTLFPAMLVLLGRRVFWPFVPRFGAELTRRAGVWGRIGRFIDRRRWLAVLGSFAVLGALAVGLTGNTGPLRQQDGFLDTPESVAGFTVLRQHFPEQGGQPMTVYVRPAYQDKVLDTVKGTSGVVEAFPGETYGGWAQIEAFPKAAPDTPQEYDTIRRVRTAVHAISGAEAIVGGPGAEHMDTDTTTSRDERIVIPLVLAVVVLILGLLLRAIVAPIMLIGTVIVSFAAAFGGSMLVFDHLLGFKGIDNAVPVLAFLFLVALGVDYNIFLMHRAREESLAHGTRSGILSSLSATGGVITSAGVVLAATFAVLATLPLVVLVELGFLVAFGVLLDALLVRSILVPALTLLLGRSVWWPSRLSAGPTPPQPSREPTPQVEEPVPQH
ncbi:MMPL family transporter [Nucisporomicrobium flavum]|uniref:MMPL family transporter n=1 Tax=Nucisporomicrobium flavum TaxID=2785915 RepID=UPI0027DD48CF|nr:MMPL family transporter [Nucisporomicrobium flavum]